VLNTAPLHRIHSEGEEAPCRRPESKGVAVIYSLSPGAAAVDIAPELAPQKGRLVVVSGPDKFLGTELDKMLREQNIRTVIVAGSSAHDTVLCTASGSALWGRKVTAPVDGISAETLYPEQYTLWQLTNAPVGMHVSVTGRTLPRSDGIGHFTNDRRARRTAGGNFPPAVSHKGSMIDAGSCRDRRPGIVCAGP
jgi:nicotinamidase-related amidase